VAGIRSEVHRAFAGDRLAEGLAACLVLPGIIGGAGLHGGEDVQRSGVIAARGAVLLSAALLTERLDFADELELQAGLGRQPIGAGANVIAQRLGPARIVEQTNTAS